MNSKVLRYVLYAAVALAAFGGGAWLGLSKLAGPVLPTANHMLLALKLPDIGGNIHEIKQWQGKVVVVNFWATWCAPCREEIPLFIDMQRTLGDKGLQFVGISIDDVVKTRDFHKTFGINYPSLIGNFDTLDVSRKAGNAKGVLPYTVVMDRKGNIVTTELGGVKREKLEALITPLL